MDNHDAEILKAADAVFDWAGNAYHGQPSPMDGLVKAVRAKREAANPKLLSPQEGRLFVLFNSQDQLDVSGLLAVVYDRALAVIRAEHQRLQAGAVSETYRCGLDAMHHAVSLALSPERRP